MALIKVISEDGAENIYDVNVPIVTSGETQTACSFAITTAAGGTPTLDITVPTGTVYMTAAGYLQNMVELMEEAVADPYAIPVFSQTYVDTDAYLAPVEYHAILTQGTTP